MTVDLEIYERTHAIVPPPVRKMKALVVGAGMVGSWVTAALARLVGEVTVMDFDNVETVNVGVQMYTPADVGQPKVKAVQYHLAGLPVSTWHERMEPDESKDRGAKMSEFDIVVSALDSMAGRAMLWESVRSSEVKLWVDVRVMGETVCFLTCPTPAHSTLPADNYASTLLPDSEVEDAPCGAEGTVYSGMFAGSRVAGIINCWARDLTIRPKEVWHVGLMDLIDREAQ
jgi:hypothetical protein